MRFKCLPVKITPKRLYDALKTVHGPISSDFSPLMSLDGETLLTEKKQILNRLTEHFKALLNRPSIIDEEAIDRLPRLEILKSFLLLKLHQTGITILRDL